MREAIGLAQSADAPQGENPRVGCLIVAPDGSVVGRGYHRGAGTPHAEVIALRDAGDRAMGSTAVVTLEPCRHVGRTGACTEALLAAGVSQVVFGQPDPTEAAGGGADVLRAAGVRVTDGVLADEAEHINEAWTFAVRNGRPMVTWKAAVSLDGRVAGAGGGPTAITGEPARERVHDLRASVGAIIVGTGTVLVDDPELTVRRPGAAPASPPVRVVMGTRTIPAEARVRGTAAPTVFTGATSPTVVLTDLFGSGVRHALLEGGPALAASFLAAGLIDRVEWYIAPLLLGAGPVSLPPMPESATPVGVDVIEVTVVGEDVRIVGRVQYQREGA